MKTKMDKTILKNKVSQDTVNKIYPLLHETVLLLDRNKVDYWATGGTLLGTVRSKGMIQWDDDIDIAIQLKDVPLLEDLKTEFSKKGLRLYEEIDLEKNKAVGIKACPYHLKDLDGSLSDLLNVFLPDNLKNKTRQILEEEMGGICNCCDS